MYTALLSFNRFIATKLVYLNNKTCMIRQTLIDLNPIELNCYPFMIILNKYNGIYYVVDELSTNAYVPIET